MTSASTSSDPPHALFFVGHFNDIDHLVPVAYKLSKTNRGRPVIIVTENSYDISGDYRLQFMKRQFEVQVIHAFRFHPLTSVAAWLVRLLNSPLWENFLHRQRSFLFRVVRKVFYGKRWARRILERYNPVTLVFEWASPNSGITGAFVAAGHDKGIPSISLPHGMLVYTNALITRDEKRVGRASRDYVNLFDGAVYQSRLHADRAIEEGVRPDIVAVLGSARYCGEWRRINLEIQPERFIPKKGEGCTYRAVFMLPQWPYNADREATIRTLRRLSSEPWLHLVLKPHTRELQTNPPYLKELNSHSNVEIVGKVGSVALIQWADAVIVVGSSIALEVLLQGKTHLDPEYLHENTTIFQEVGAEWTVHSDEELVSALRRLQDGQPTPYSAAQVSQAVTQLVLGGTPDVNVLERYVDYILGEWREMSSPPARTHDAKFAVSGQPPAVPVDQGKRT